MAQAAQAAASGNRATFNSLPDELIVQVVDHLAGDAQSLCALARANRFLQIESEKRIYANIKLLNTADLHAIIDAFTRRPERISAVETLEILYRFHDELGATAEERSVFNRCVANMKALRTWHIESPYDDFKWDNGGESWVLGDMEEFRKALESASLREANGSLSASPDVGLSKLEKLVIHTHGAESDFWQLGKFECLFRHPSLRYLHVSCLVLPSAPLPLDKYAKSTPLNTLIFDECELEPRSLASLLMTPKRLSNLVLGENVYNIKQSRCVRPRLSMDPQGALEALSHVSSSLETLIHHDPYWRSNRDSRKPRFISGDGMRHFHKLKLLQADACSFLHRSVIQSPNQAPPNLHTLQIRHARRNGPEIMFAPVEADDFFQCLPPAEPYLNLKSLKQLDFIQGTSQEAHMASPHHICEPESLQKRHSYAYELSKHGINVRVYLEGTFKITFIPPFLYREPQPQLVCVYDAEDVGFGVVKPYGPQPAIGSEEYTQETDELTKRDIFRLRDRAEIKLERAWHAMYDHIVANRAPDEDDEDDWEDDEEDEDGDGEDEDPDDDAWMDQYDGGEFAFSHELDDLDDDSDDGDNVLNHLPDIPEIIHHHEVLLAMQTQELNSLQAQSGTLNASQQARMQFTTAAHARTTQALDALRAAVQANPNGLTQAQMVALMTTVFGLMGNDDYEFGN